jgi:hypothetical protein
METAFHYDPKEKHLSFLLRENVTADPDIQLRLRGRLNTATAGLEYHATAQKFLSTGTAIKVPPRMLSTHASVYNWPTSGGYTQFICTPSRPGRQQQQHPGGAVLPKGPSCV